MIYFNKIRAMEMMMGLPWEKPDVGKFVKLCVIVRGLVFDIGRSSIGIIKKIDQVQDKVEILVSARALGIPEKKENGLELYECSCSKLKEMEVCDPREVRSFIKQQKDILRENIRSLKQQIKQSQNTIAQYNTLESNLKNPKNQ